MKALTFLEPQKIDVVEKARPEIKESTDVIVKMLKTTICGTDLHIISGDTPEVPKNLTLGHEGVGEISEIGEGVTNFNVGDKVLISCITSCGRCEFCKKGLYAHCKDGGWILGHLIDGTQAEYVRIPHADNSLYLIPENLEDEVAVMLSDILPTGFEIGVLNGQVKPGDTLAIIGAGPVGMATLLTAQFYSPAKIIMVDLDDHRLELAKKLGATDVINSTDSERAIQQIFELSNGIGVDVAMEVVGIPSTFDLCQRILAPGGHIANVGVHGKSVELHLEELWIKNITLTTGLVSTSSTPMLLKTVSAGRMAHVDELISHHYTFDEILKAHDTFKNASVTKALKVIIHF
ncbi:zinc-dependent alcohol dehydrogenase family protein [Listeria rustica]|uniref:Zinc-dependent alcohol dehydrogenase family protein n=1 Tax=Listeria rustica TaxID=2713503 RepID=A0A7W1T8E5_9LIST|nr:zinc-dependent alcohol dehydrogenase family protein [Listeria rustica]MBA3927397.1 zinc-dependent alcohol dehydrogenase family protein [Listeria rustica]